MEARITDLPIIDKQALRQRVSLHRRMRGLEILSENKKAG